MSLAVDWDLFWISAKMGVGLGGVFWLSIMIPTYIVFGPGSKRGKHSHGK